MNNRFELEANLPLTEVTFYILLSLSRQPRHGYAIMKDTRSLSDQRVDLSTGTLYGAIKRLLEQGWITRVNDGDKTDGRDRKAYALTDLGRRILDAEVDRLNTMVTAAHLRVVEQHS
jgi:DNA-binding PadR family transcriptional regulator